MKKQLYDTLSWISAIIAVTATLLFDRSPNLQALAWILVIIAAGLALGTYLYNRLQGDQEGEVQALLVLDTTEKALDVGRDELRARASVNADAYKSIFAMCLSNIHRESIRHSLEGKYHQFWIPGPTPGGGLSIPNFNNDPIRSWMEDIGPAANLPNEVHFFVSVIHTLSATNMGKDLEVVLMPNGEITVRSTRARMPEERSEFSQAFEQFSVPLPVQ